MTRQSKIIDEKKPRDHVDNGVVNPLELDYRLGDAGQGSGSGGTKIHEDTWSEFLLVANYLYRNNEDAEIADVFEFFRLKDMGGREYSPALLKRVTREVETDCGPF